MFGRPIRVLACSAAICAAISACGSSTGGGTTLPTADTGDQPETKPPGGSATAPQVVDPIDVSGFLSRPCDVFSSRQLAGLGNNGSPRPSKSGELGSDTGPACSWQDSDDSNVIGFVFATANEKGLNSYYEAKEAYGPDYFGYFEPTSVAGYPALYQSGGSDERQYGNCNIAVGINEKLAFAINQQGGEGRQSCDVVKRAASSALETLKGES